MRVVLSTFGTTGDVEPMLALAVELRRHAHHPVLVLSPNFGERTRQLGLDFIPMGPEMSLKTVGEVMTAQIQMKNRNPAGQVREFLEAMLPILPEIYGTLKKACENADVLVGSPFQFACRMVQEATGIPYVSLHLSQFGDLGAEETRKVSASLINVARARQGFPALHDPLGTDGTSEELALFAVSSHILSRPARWPSHYRIVGFFFLNQEDWQPDDELKTFCEAGAAPIVVSFGSVVHADPASLSELILQAVELAGCRAVIQSGWSGLTSKMSSSNVHWTKFVPHSWLFPRAPLVIHHGGAGTSAAVFRAGVPSLVVPHFLDQSIWGEFARAKGCARNVIPFAQLTAPRLAVAIRASLASSSIRDQATAFAKPIQMESGVQTACGLIEEMLSAARLRMTPASSVSVA